MITVKNSSSSLIKFGTHPFHPGLNKIKDIEWDIIQDYGSRFRDKLPKALEVVENEEDEVEIGPDLSRTAHKLAIENGLSFEDTSRITGTGKDGTIVKADIVAFLASKEDPDADEDPDGEGSVIEDDDADPVDPEVVDPDAGEGEENETTTGDSASE